MKNEMSLDGYGVMELDEREQISSDGGAMCFGGAVALVRFCENLWGGIVDGIPEGHNKITQ